MINSIFIFERLDYLITTKKTGTRSEMASKFGVSERTISRWLNIMRDCGAEIEFCKIRKSFAYKKPGKFLILMKFSEAV